MTISSDKSHRNWNERPSDAFTRRVAMLPCSAVARAELCFFLTLFYAMADIRAAYDEVYVYTMGRPGFILQHVVDAFVVQTATADTKPIAVVFGLVGLYLHLEMEFSGREVQKAHMALAKAKRAWPNLYLPDDRGSMTAADVLAANAGPERDRAIEEWCKSVWAACIPSRDIIVDLLREQHLI